MLNRVGSTIYHPAPSQAHPLQGQPSGSGAIVGEQDGTHDVVQGPIQDVDVVGGQNEIIQPGMGAAETERRLRQMLGIDMPRPQGEQPEFVSERVAPRRSSSFGFPAGGRATSALPGHTSLLRSVPRDGVPSEPVADRPGAPQRFVPVIPLEAEQNRLAELGAPLLPRLGGAGRDAHVSLLSEVAAAPVVPQQELRLGGPKLYWFWAGMSTGNGLAQVLKKVACAAPVFYAGTIVAGGIEAFTVCTKRRRQHAEQRGLNAVLEQLRDATARYREAATRYREAARRYREAARRYNSRTEAAVDIARPSSEDAMAVIESVETSVRLAHLEKSDGPSRTMLVRDTPVQLTGGAMKTATLIGKLTGFFPTVVSSAISAIVSTVAGGLHAVQGKQEWGRAESAQQVLRTFADGPVAWSAASEDEPKAVLRALDQSVRRSRRNTQGTRFDRLLDAANGNELGTVFRVAKEVRTALVKNLSDSIQACTEQARTAKIRMVYGLTSASLSGAVSVFALSEMSGPLVEGTTLGLTVLSTTWLVYAAVRLGKADRARKQAVSLTATPQECSKIILWATLPLSDLEAAVRTEALVERFFTSVLLLRLLTKPKPPDKDAPQDPAEEALDLHRKIAKRLLELVAFTEVEIAALETVSRGCTPQQLIDAVEYIYAHIVGNMASEKKISDVADTWRLTLSPRVDRLAESAQGHERAAIDGD
ncbi:hypothetical protein PSP31121_05235 [Pandoraea sputorum]|uniref:Uncharacterized protein n=2 Tax=Pandoraea sputorum TaxID=93222 RepID=A0A5E5BJF8_9BURK|nr:hypothetical protein PSP31121_05235 [Pandoraea sputorum]